MKQFRGDTKLGRLFPGSCLHGPPKGAGKVGVVKQFRGDTKLGELLKTITN